VRRHTKKGNKSYLKDLFMLDDVGWDGGWDDGGWDGGGWDDGGWDDGGG
jgi:hypothetical protein